LRALAALLVFEWHFTHPLIPSDYVPSFWPLAFINQGHIGVALFMTLSGYLFTKLLNNRNINYRNFFWNRFLRLAPLFVVVLIVYAIVEQRGPMEYLSEIAKGLFITTHMPIGTWSIVVEVHFYILLPFLMFLVYRNPLLLILFVLLAIGLRFTIYWSDVVDIKKLSYWTIFGRIDQFVFGMLAFHFRTAIAWRHIAAVALLLIFSPVYYEFNSLGGYDGDQRLIWVILPSIEALFLSALIAYYDTSFSFTSKGCSGMLAQIGGCSFSIYLWHTFIVFRAARWLHIENFYLSAVAALIVFLLLCPLAWLSYRYFEMFFLRFRLPYVIAYDGTSQIRNGLRSSATIRLEKASS
jgi:peptidoglycan/LPS O-acetylase OafA/YrhL